MKDETEIVKEMWAFQREQAVRQEHEQFRAKEEAREQAMRALRLNGISPPSRNRQSAPPVAETVEWYNKRQSKLPEIYWEWISPAAESRLSAGDIWMLNQHVKNLEVSRTGKEAREEMRQGEAPKLLNFQLVPQSALPSQTAAQEIIPTPPLTPTPPPPITLVPSQKGKP